MHRPLHLLLLLPAAAIVTLAACSGPAPAPTATTATTTVTASATPATTVTATTTASPSASASATSTAADPDRPAGQCADRVLRVTLGAGGAAAGTTYRPIVFTNTGSTSCVLRGAPGVSVVGDGDGTQLGAPATRNQAGARDVRLDADGGQAHAELGVVDFGDDGSPLQHCTVKPGDGFRVYPPHSTTAFFVRASGTRACSPGPSFMNVDVVASGASGGR